MAIMPKRSTRLETVAELIPDGVHADIGSDHGYLLFSLLREGRITRGIAIENKPTPFANSKRTLDALAAETRLADGLDGLRPGEADSVSLSGMGGELIAKVLGKHPERVPPSVIAQPNTRPECVRRWAWDNGFHLSAERFVIDKHRFVVMRFDRCDSAVDPAYDSIDFESALLFGPLLLRDPPAHYVTALNDEHRYLAGLDRLDHRSRQRFDALSKAIADHGMA